MDTASLYQPIIKFLREGFYKTLGTSMFNLQFFDLISWVLKNLLKTNLIFTAFYSNLSYFLKCIFDFLSFSEFFLQRTTKERSLMQASTILMIRRI